MQRLTQFDVYELPVAEIFYDWAFNCRTEFTPQSVKELADSIKDNGLLFPVAVQPWTAEPGYAYRVVAGHRRFKAATTFLGWSSIPTSVRTDLTPRTAALLNFTENLERKDLNILEEATALARLYPDGVTLEVAAKELKRPSRWVHIRLRLLTMPEGVQKQAAAGLLSACNLEALAGREPDEQILLATKIVEAKESGCRIVDPACKRPFKGGRSKAQIVAMISRMLEAGLVGIGPRMGAWCAGYISDEDIIQDIENLVETNRLTSTL